MVTVRVIQNLNTTFPMMRAIFYFPAVLSFILFLRPALAFENDQSIYYRQPSRGSANRLLLNPPYLQISFPEPAQPSVGQRPALPPVRLFVTYPSGSMNKQPGSGYPIMLFLSGMYGRVPTYWYQDLYTRMAVAGQGMVVVAMDMLTTPPNFFVSTDRQMMKVLEWIKQGNLQGHIAVADALEGSPGNKTTKCDMSRVILGAHSSGAQSLVVALQKVYQDVNAVVLIDPVDGMGEFRGADPSSSSGKATFPVFSASQLHSLNTGNTENNLGASSLSYPPAVIDTKNQSQLAHIRLPLFILATGLCSKPALKIPRPPFIDGTMLPPIFTSNETMWPACCPLDLGPERFWKAFGGSNGILAAEKNQNQNQNQFVFQLTNTPESAQSTWGYLVNVTEFGHCDLLDDVWTWTNRQMRLCESAVAARRRRGQWNPYDMSSFRRLIAATISAFTDIALYGNCGAETFLTDPSTMSEKVRLDRMNNRC